MAPNFECFTKYDAFCLHSFNYACSRRFAVMQTAGVKIGEDFQKRVSTSEGRSPPDPPTGALLWYTQSLDFAEIDS